jgi:hypothetical protein
LSLGRATPGSASIREFGALSVAIVGNGLETSTIAALGVVGYFLGARRLGAATVVVGVAAVLFVAAVGLIPGLEPPGHGYQD